MSDRPKRVRNKDLNIPVKANGLPKKLKLDGTPDARGVESTGGPGLGQGRKPIQKHMTNYHKAISLLDESAIDAINTLIEGLSHDDVGIRIKCAEILLKKTISDKKRNEHTGEGGGPILVARGDMKEAIAEVDRLIEERHAEGKIIDAEIIEEYYKED